MGVSRLTKMSELGDQLLTSQSLSCSAAVSSGNAMGSTMQRDERSCRTDARVAVVGPWTTIHDAVVQRMLGGEA